VQPHFCRRGKEDDSYIRKAAIKHRIPYITSAEAVVATVEGICAAIKSEITVKSLQAYHRDLELSDKANRVSKI
jgi:carbamoyl-phosphate synthase large subunit